MLSGCSGPWLRSRSASAPAKVAIASPKRPADSYAMASRSRAASVVPWAGPSLRVLTVITDCQYLMATSFRPLSSRLRPRRNSSG